MIQVEKAGATPNLLKYRVTADHKGGEIVIDHEKLTKDARGGPLKRFFTNNCINLESDDEACDHLLCNPSMRVFITPRNLARVAVNAIVKDKALALFIEAEEDASAILAIEFRHSIAA